MVRQIYKFLIAYFLLLFKGRARLWRLMIGCDVTIVVTGGESLNTDTWQASGCCVTARCVVVRESTGNKLMDSHYSTIPRIPAHPDRKGETPAPQCSRSP